MCVCVCVYIQLSSAASAPQQSEVTHAVTTAVTKVTTREKVSAVRQTRESPPPQKKRQVTVDSELRKRCVVYSAKVLSECKHSITTVLSNLCDVFSFMHPFLLSYLSR